MRLFYVQIDLSTEVHMIITSNAAYANLLCDRAFEQGYYFSLRVQ